MKRKDYVGPTAQGSIARFRTFITQGQVIIVNCDRAFSLRRTLFKLDPLRFAFLVVFEWAIYIASPASLASLIWWPWWVPTITILVSYIVAYPSLKQSYADMCYSMYAAGKVSGGKLVELGIFAPAQARMDEGKTSQ